MSIFVYNQSQRKIPSIGSLKLDTNLSESHEYSNTITDHPLERGFSVSDAIIHNPMVLTMECVVSANSLYPDRISDNNSPFRADSAYSKLIQLANADALVTVVSTIKTYPNMAIESISVPRDKDIGKSLEFTITFKQVRVVNASSIQIEQLEGNDTALGITELEDAEQIRGLGFDRILDEEFGVYGELIDRDYDSPNPNVDLDLGYIKNGVYYRYPNTTSFSERSSMFYTEDSNKLTFDELEEQRTSHNEMVWRMNNPDQPRPITNPQKLVKSPVEKNLDSDINKAGNAKIDRINEYGGAKTWN
jgi:hypothetical protein